MSAPTRVGAPEAAAGTTRGRLDLAVDPHQRRRVVLWTLGVVTALAVVGIGAAASPLLDVETVEVAGAPTERIDEVRAAAGIDVGDSIVTFLPGSVAQKVRDLPWVADATVTRTFPDSVRIDVVARVPVGWVRAGERVLVVDGDSRVLWRTATPPPALPELVGIADLAAPGGIIAPAVPARTAAVLGPELRGRVAAVTLADGTVVAQVGNGPEIRFGGPRKLAMKARVANAVIAALAGAPARYVDVSVPAAPVTG